jgi:Nickel responsive protein SCO4226-like
MAGYLVERYLPGLTAAEVHAAIRRMTAVVEEMAAEGIPIRYVTSAFIPEEEACFCQFEAPSREAVAAANERAAFPYARILAVDLAPGDQRPPIRGRGDLRSGLPAGTWESGGGRPAAKQRVQKEGSDRR